jgi:hypothetical protein
MTFEPRPQPSCVEPLPARAEEEPAVVATVEESSAPPPSVAATAIEEGQPTVETAAPQAALEPPTGVGSGGTDVVVVLDEDSVPPHRWGIVMS